MKNYRVDTTTNDITWREEAAVFGKWATTPAEAWKLVDALNRQVTMATACAFTSGRACSFLCLSPLSCLLGKIKSWFMLPVSSV